MNPVTDTAKHSDNLDQWVLRFAGIFILLSLALAQWLHPGFIWFTVFVGANLLQTSYTGLCPLVKLLQKLGVQPGRAFCQASELNNKR